MILLPLIFFKIVVIENQIFKIDTGKLWYENLAIREEIIDYCIHENLYVLTERYVICIDTADLKIIDQTPLPQRFNFLTLSRDEILLVSSSEIIKLNRHNLSFKGGIGIEPGDYEPMVSPVLLPAQNQLYLISHGEKKSIIRVFDTERGRKLYSATFPRISDFKYLPEKKCFLTLDSSTLNFIDPGLKIVKKIKLPYRGDRFVVEKYGYIITNKQAIFYINPEGKVIDFQPVYLNEQVKNNGFIFFNSEFIIFIDPFTLRIKKIVENSEGIQEIYYLDKYYYVGINKNGQPVLFDVLASEIKLLKKRDIFPPLLKTNLQPVSDSLLYYIQFNAFADGVRAMNFYDSLRTIGLPVVIDSSVDSLYRIKLGGFYNKNEALKISEKINMPVWIVYHEKLDYKIDSVFKFNGFELHIIDGVIKTRSEK
ncbi:MAG: SPOR domain-containing protein [candidate division WOR-3 bacterium]|nr:SPOR domain-containing protein [candidate division WOR-3 bacterium]